MIKVFQTTLKLRNILLENHSLKEEIKSEIVNLLEHKLRTF